MKAKGPPSWSPLTPLIGRDEEQRAITDLSRERRLVTLLGPPGVGKSHLARACALESTARRPRGGVWFCEASEARSLEDLCGLVANAVDVPLTNGDAASCLGEHFASLGETVLVLDGVDGAVDATAELLPRWLAAAPNLRCIVTSRQRLRIAPEATIVIEPLSGEAGIALFVERARAARSRVLDGDAERSCIAEIVEVCDGIPLALELAAEQTVVLSLSELLQKLEPDLSLLDAGLRGAPARHRSMRAAIEWSWRELGDSEQSVLAQCAVFGGDFTFAAAEAVVRPSARGPALAVMLARLCDRSLLLCPMPGGPLLLQRTTRAFALERLTERAEGGAAFGRHADYCLTEGKLASLGDRAGERNGCTRADLVAIAERGTHPGPARGVTREQAVLAICLLAESSSETRAVSKHLDVVLSESRGLDRELVAHARVARARVRRHAGRCADALTDLRAALRLTSTPALCSTGYSEIGHVRRQQGRPSEARQAYERALDLAASAGAKDRARVLSSLGALCFEQGELGEAQRLHDEALLLYEACADRRGAATVFHNAALIAQEQGHLERAEGAFEKAYALHVEMDNHRFAGIARFDLAGVHLERGLWAAARSDATEAVDLLSKAGDARYAALALALRGSALAALGLLAEARADMERAETVFSVAGDCVFGRVAAVYRGHLELAEALRAYTNGADEECSALLRRAQTRIRRFEPRRTPPITRRNRESDELRLSHRILRKTVRRHLGFAESLLVAKDQSWFRGPGAQRSDLGGRAAARRILGSLVERRLTRPELQLSCDELVRRGWPGERLSTASATNRLQVLLTQLRKMGLERALLRRAGGYLIDPELLVFVL